MMRHSLFEINSTHLPLSHTAKQYLEDESGSTTIEVGLISALVGVLLITGAGRLGGSINDKFSDIANLFDGPAEPPTPGDEPP